MELDYAGDLTPKQAWSLLKEDENCQLVDCRTAASLLACFTQANAWDVPALWPKPTSVRI